MVGRNVFTIDGIRSMSIGIGLSPRGLREEDQRPDYILVDDVDNKKHVNNDCLMREGVDWIFEDLIGCCNETDGSVKRFVFANNNSHRNSITQRLKDKFRKQAEKSRVEGKNPVHHALTIKAVTDLNTFTPECSEKTSEAYWRHKYAFPPTRSFMRYMHVHI
ncbi:hypothetical protein Barb6_02870 [Bacteroidales bacterium Barb6]|nr:hypothetical protein Barb6_02870 [Bacteroidales bacterium Barb6]